MPLTGFVSICMSLECIMPIIFRWLAALMNGSRWGFEVSEANRKAKCLEIKAYDYMVRFEKAFTSLVSIGNAYDFMVFCSTGM